MSAALATTRVLMPCTPPWTTRSPVTSRTRSKRSRLRACCGTRRGCGERLFPFTGAWPVVGGDIDVDRSAHRHQLDQPGVEGRQVVGLAAGQQVAVHDDLLVDPGGACVADVGLQARPRRQG